MILHYRGENSIVGLAPNLLSGPITTRVRPPGYGFGTLTLGPSTDSIVPVGPDLFLNSRETITPPTSTLGAIRPSRGSGRNGDSLSRWFAIMIHEPYIQTD